MCYGDLASIPIAATLPKGRTIEYGDYIGIKALCGPRILFFGGGELFQPEKYSILL
jgi:hypothetical protein